MNVPKLRFKEFDGEWEENFLERTIYVKSGKDYKHLDKGNIPVYGTGGYMLSVNDYLSDKDAIGIGRKGSIDKPQKLKAPFWTVDTLFYCIPKQDHNLSFLFTLFQKIPWKRYDESTGVPSLSKSSIEKIKINIPPNDEQEKIGGFFKELDKKIQLQQQKIDLLQEQKKGFLQKMFPKAGETQPEIRFEGFTENWKPHKLSDGMIEYTERVFIEDEKLYKQISVKNIGEITIRGEKIGSEIGRKRQARVNLDEHPYTLIFTRQTVEQGGIGFAPKQTNGAIVTENMPTIEVDVRIFDKDYLLALFKTSLWYRDIILFNVEGGTAQVAIHEDNILSSETVFPSIEEQKNIGAFFKNLNKKIEVEQKKLKLLQKQKQGFMQQMFI